MKTELPTTDELANTLNNIVSQSGLLFQAHPTLPGWEVTRPGAMEAEVVAFKNKSVYPAFVRLSLRVFYAGETDEDGITYGEDTHIVETLDNGPYPWEERAHDTAKAALLDMASIMLDVADAREPKDDSEIVA